MFYFKKVHSYDDLLALSKSELIERSNSVNLLFYIAGFLTSAIIVAGGLVANNTANINTDTAPECIITQYGTYCK